MKKPLIITATLLTSFAFTSCIDDDSNDFEDCRRQTDEYHAAIDEKEFTKIVPEWAPDNSVFIKWHNDRSLNQNSLTPLSTSTVNIKYELEDIEGTDLGNSYNAEDSIYQSKVNTNIIGMCAALLSMHVGDSVTMVIPYNSAYGENYNGRIKPYSNLIYRVKFKEIVAFEKPND